MKISDFIWDEIVHGGHWGSLSAPAVALSFMYIIGDIHWELLVIVYLATQAIYTYNHYKEIEKDELSNAPRVRHLKRYKEYLPLITACYSIGFFSILFYFANRFALYFGSFLFLLGILFTHRGKHVTTSIPGFKTIYASLCWGMIIIFVTIYCNYSFDLRIFLLFVFVFLRFVVDTIFFDIKDAEVDKRQGLLTIPIVLENKVKCLKFLHTINFLSLLPIMIGIVFDILPVFTISIALTVIYTFVYLEKSKQKDADILSISYILVDGEYVFWPFYLLVGNIIFDLLV
ncbi:MAG: hypothetical protein DRN25_06010 [Thermoplasmata archaeon]|nr:MAG: hypothetical protein DRN25_06010 [Thermoplasmata archaeon]